MSHLIPSYYRYVESITITNAGSGYDPASPPTITISGGGGTGATATCTVNIGGTIDTVTVTNIGNGYTSTPTVTVSGSGGAVLTAVLNFATGPSSEHTETNSESVRYTLPEYVREDYTTFVTFIEKYYTWMEQDGNPINLLLNKKYYDIDTAEGDELENWRLKLARNWPSDLPIDKKFFYKNIKNIYESKGTKESVETFFRLFYGEEVSVIYPSKFVLRASDGRWVERQAIKLTSANNYEVLNLNGALIDIHYFTTTGSVTNAVKIPASVVSVSKVASTSPQQYIAIVEFVTERTTIPGPGANENVSLVFEGPISTVDTIGAADASRATGSYTITSSDWTSDGAGTGAEFTVDVDGSGAATITVDTAGSGFVVDETITIADSDLGGGGGAALTFDIATLVEGSLKIKDVSITSGGYDYTAAPVVEIYDTTAPGGTGASIRCVVENNAISDFVINNKGSGYTSTTTSIVLNYDSIRTFVTLRGETSSASNAKAYLGRSLTSISAGTYSGANAGFKSNEFYRINENGDDAIGYALDYFAEDYVLIGGSNRASAKITTLDSTNTPATWSIVSSGFGFNNAQTTLTLTSKTGETATFTITTGYLFNYDGEWTDDRGKLSDVNRLQDNQRYQSYSYIVKSANPQSDWNADILATVHPAGWAVFGDLTILNEVDYSSNYTVTSPGYHIRFFEEDIFAGEGGETSEAVAIFYELTLPTDTATATEAHVIQLDKLLSDSAVTDDSGSQTYFAEDYMLFPDTYVSEGGFVINFDKVLSEAIATAESLVPEVDWNRAFTETATTSEDVVTLLEILRSHSDSVTVSEVVSVVRNIFHTATDSATVSQSDVKSVGKNVTESLSATELVVPVTTWDREFTESQTVSETIVKSIARPFSDGASTSESVVTQIFIPLDLTDTATVADSGTVISIGKNITETPSTTDAPVINTSKTVSDTLSNSETVAKNYGQSQTDTVNNSEVATANVQDYTDPTYFAEDYVGTNYTLT